VALTRTGTSTAAPIDGGGGGGGPVAALCKISCRLMVTWQQCA
jgi:hypothetical protein